MAAILQPLAQGKQGWPWTEATDPAIYAGLPSLPSVSVLVPSYNQAGFLEECIRSILGQQYPNLEILIADGGSTDASPQIIAHYKHALAWALSEKDQGTWDADNKALERASGEYVLVVNSDDMLLKNGLYHLLKTLLDSPTADWATGKVRAINQVGETKAVFSPAPPGGAEEGRTFLKECWIFHPSTIVRRSLIERFMPVDVMDWEVWIRLERQGLLPAISPCQVAALRFHADCKSFDTPRIYANNLKLLGMIEDQYPDRLVKEKARTYRQYQEALMVQKADDGDLIAAQKRWWSFLLERPSLWLDRPYWGLGRRLWKGQLADLYRPMAFLDSTYTTSPEDTLCA